jgi:hypothetical protein
VTRDAFWPASNKRQRGFNWLARGHAPFRTGSTLRSTR